jgi:hypothetical protein
MQPPPAPTSAPASRPADRFPRGFTRVNDRQLLVNFGETSINDILDEFARVSGFKVSKTAKTDAKIAALVSLSPTNVEDVIELLNVSVSGDGLAVVWKADTVSLISLKEQDPAAPSPERFLSLDAILDQDGRYVAYVKDHQQDKTFQLRVGDPVLDGTVIDVRSDLLIYRREGGGNNAVLLGKTFDGGEPPARRPRQNSDGSN